MFESILKNINLTADEIKVYELLLTQGEMSARQVIVGASLKRGTTYYVLRGLKNKGLVEEFAKYKKSYFRLEPPSRLRGYLEGRVRQIKESSATLESALPEMLSQYNLVLHKPGIRFYEGLEGIKEVHRQILNEKKEILAYVYIDNELEKPLAGFWEWYYKERRRNNIFVRSLSPNNEDGVKYQLNDKEQLRETRLVPQDKFLFSIEKNICGHKVAFISLKESLATIVESPEIATTERSIFELAWNEAGRTNLSR